MLPQELQDIRWGRVRGSKGGTARTGAAYTPWKRERRDIGGGKPNRRENE